MSVEKLNSISGELTDTATAILSAARLVKQDGLTPAVAEALHEQAEKLEVLSATLKAAVSADAA